MQRIVIFANGSLPNLPAAKALLRPDDFLLGADGGASFILKMGLTPHLVIGDLDSLNEDDLYELTFADVPIEQHPADKDETDLQLALERALETQPQSILVIGALGGRIDQTLANISLAARASQVDVYFDDGVERLSFCRAAAEVAGSIGDIISLLPWNGDARGVTTAGLKWRLHGETLYAHQTRGVSNELTAETASIQIESGLLLIVHRRTN
ncbi:MAG: thiamine diphosphokinase [Anaerolineales bacterium]